MAVERELNLLAKYSLNRREKAVINAIIAFLIISKNVSVVTYKSKVLHFHARIPPPEEGG